MVQLAWVILVSFTHFTCTLTHSMEIKFIICLPKASLTCTIIQVSDWYDHRYRFTTVNDPVTYLNSVGVS